MTTGYSTNPRQVNIAVVMNPLQVNAVGLEVAVTNIVDVLKPISNKIFIITGGYPQPDDEKVRIIQVKPKIITGEKDKLTISRVLEHFIAQLKLSFQLLKQRKQIDIVIYNIGGKTYSLSMMVARLLKKKIIICSFSSARKAAKLPIGKELPPMLNRFQLQILKLLETVSFRLSHRIWVESKNVIRFSELGGYKDNISICGGFYIDTAQFKKRKELNDRGSLVGCISRLEEGKGTLGFINAIPMVLAQREGVEFLIIGDGSLSNRIEGEIRGGRYQGRVRLLGRIAHNQVPEYLNELKLLVLPSISEGLPAIVQEAMACGTPVLATSVGGVPDLITDGETGFILEDNSPQCIARNIIRALEYPGLEKVCQNARELIEKEYSYQVMVEKYRDAIAEVMNKG